MRVNRKSLDLSRIATKLLTAKWMLSPMVHASLCRSVEHCLSGEISYVEAEPQPEPAQGEGSTAVISISGVLVKGASELEEQLLGLTNIDAISEGLDQVTADPGTQDIVLALSSPGGETLGIEELGRKIKAIDETIKPVYVWTESQMCSAAYWIGSQGRLLGMTPSSQVGSVGVYMVVLDQTRQLDMQGIKAEPFFSGKYKLMGHEFHTLTPEEKELLQADVQKQHEKFKQVILSKRPQIQPEELEGLSFEGEDALSKGFVDVLKDSFGAFLQSLPH